MTTKKRKVFREALKKTGNSLVFYQTGGVPPNQTISHFVSQKYFIGLFHVLEHVDHSLVGGTPPPP